MKRSLFVLGLLASLAACGDGQPLFDDNGSGGGGGGGGGGNPPPTTSDGLVTADISRNLKSVSFVPPSGSNDGTLLVNVESLDSSPLVVPYVRNPSLDVPGYVAYSLQEDPLDRFYTGLAARSADGSIQAAVVADGGQFNRYFGGTRVERRTPYSAYVPPTTPTGSNPGLVSYAGNYAGLLNVGTRDGTLPADGADPALLPRRATQVSGEIFLNADFTNSSVNGAIVNRQVVGFDRPLVDVVLVATSITADGRFQGGAENRDLDGIGSYAGAFGGAGATSVAGGTFLQDFDEEWENEEERGVFVLTRCGLPGNTSAVCGIVNPR